MLTFTATLPAPDDTNQLQQLDQVDEILLEHEQLSRWGRLDESGLDKAIHQARNLGKRIVLVWDVLANDRSLFDGAALLRRLPLDLIDAIRTQDPGVAMYVREQFQKPLQLVLETGNHNLTGVRAWIDQFQPERAILSNELPISTIAEHVKELGCPVEVMVLGRILIFYSPRRLIGAAEGREALDEVLERYATEAETRKHFPLMENRHGTFMYYEKDLMLLPYLDEVRQAGVSYARLELKYYAPDIVPATSAWLQAPGNEKLEAIQHFMAPRLTRGFFKTNRTDKQFAKLKNRHVAVRETQALVATVLETRKKAYTALQVTQPIDVGDRLEIDLPEGESLIFDIAWIRDTSGHSLDQAPAGSICLVNHIRKASAGAKIYPTS